MQIMCSRGCGHAITVTQEMVDEAVKQNAPLNVAHDVCPNDPQAKPKNFRVELAVYEVVGTGRYVCELCGIVVDQTVDGWFHTTQPDTEHAVIPKENLRDELLTRFGNMAAGGSFKLAVPIIGERLSELWQRVIHLQDVLSEELPPANAEVEQEQVEASLSTEKEG